MAKNKQQKQIILSKYETLISDSKAIYLAKSNLTVNDSTAIKKELVMPRGVLSVVKNTLFKIAFKNKLNQEIDLNGQYTVIFCLEDVVKPAKILSNLIKEERAKIDICVYQGNIVENSKFESISNLESIDVLQSKLANVLNAPTTSFVRALNQNILKICYALNTIKEKKIIIKNTYGK